MVFKILCAVGTGIFASGWEDPLINFTLRPLYDIYEPAFSFPQLSWTLEMAWGTLCGKCC